MADLEALRRILTEAVTAAFQPLKESIDIVQKDVATLKDDVTVLKDDVAVLKVDFSSVKKAAEGHATAQVVRLSNAEKGPTDALKRLTVNYKGDPLPGDVPQPTCWAQLAVGGSECVPFIGSKNTWTRADSKQLLAAYYCEDGGDDTDGEGEYGKRARGRRLAVAELLGVSAIRLQAASFV